MHRTAPFRKIINSPLPPLPVTVDQFNAPSSPGMKGVRYREVLRVLLRTGCSPHLDPNRTRRPPSAEVISLGSRFIGRARTFACPC